MAVLSVPREVSAFAPVRRAMSSLVRDSGASTVVVEFAGLAPLIDLRSPGARWILSLHNLGSVMAQQEAAVAVGARQRWLYRRDALSAAQWERRIVPRFDDVICVSAEDRRVLDPHSEHRITVIPNGVELGMSRPAPLRADPVVIFTGNELLSPADPRGAWRELGPPFSKHADGFGEDRVFVSLADATQQLYLGLPSIHEQRKTAIDRS